MELNKITTLPSSAKDAAVSAMEKAGFGALRSGLGLAPGKYKLMTATGENIFGIKAVKGAKANYGLTLVAGTITGAEATNAHISVTYGVGDSDKQLVLTFDQWKAVEPNQAYDMVIGTNGRVQSIVPINSENVVETSKVITSKKKAVTV